MNPRPDPASMGGFGAPPQAPSGPSKFLGYVKTAASGGFLVMVGMYAAQYLPEKYTPATTAGVAAGQTVKAEIDTQALVKTAYEAGLAEATNQAQARSAMEIEDNRQQQQLIADSLKSQADMANAADMFCVGSMLVTALGANTTGNDWHDGAQSVAQVTCPAGQMLRQNITREQTQAGRTGGVLMTRNTYGQTTVPVPVAMPAASAQVRPLAPAPVRYEAPVTLDSMVPAAISASGRPSHHYSVDELLKVLEYTMTLPKDVQNAIRAGVPAGQQQNDIVADRTLAYYAAHHS